MNTQDLHCPKVGFWLELPFYFIICMTPCFYLIDLYINHLIQQEEEDINPTLYSGIHYLVWEWRLDSPPDNTTFEYSDTAGIKVEEREMESIYQTISLSNTSKLRSSVLILL